MNWALRAQEIIDEWSHFKIMRTQEPELEKVTVLDFLFEGEEGVEKLAPGVYWVQTDGWL
jgi:hypothetical protein